MKTILITGATDGIGLATARTLVTQGHQVLLHGRNPDKLSRVEHELATLAGAGPLESYVADLSDLNAVANLAQRIQQTHHHLDIVINNAGIFRTAQPRTAAGLDIRFVVNTLAPALLTRQLQSLLTADSRVINLSSAAQAPVDCSALRGDAVLDNDFEAYAQSKLALTIWTRQTALIQDATGPALIAVNPGSMLASKMVQEGFGVQGNDLSIGTDILCRAALDEAFARPDGRYFDNDSEQFSPAHPTAQDPAQVNAVMQTIDSLLSPFSGTN